MAFLSYYPHKIPLFFLHKCFFRHNYAHKNSYQRWPATLNLYVKIMYIENFFCLSWKVPIFELRLSWTEGAICANVKLNWRRTGLQSVVSNIIIVHISVTTHVGFGYCSYSSRWAESAHGYWHCELLFLHRLFNQNLRKNIH